MLSIFALYSFQNGYDECERSVLRATSIYPFHIPAQEHERRKGRFLRSHSYCVSKPQMLRVEGGGRVERCGQYKDGTRRRETYSWASLHICLTRWSLNPSLIRSSLLYHIRNAAHASMPLLIVCTVFAAEFLNCHHKAFIGHPWIANPTFALELEAEISLPFSNQSSPRSYFLHVALVSHLTEPDIKRALERCWSMCVTSVWV